MKLSVHHQQNEYLALVEVVVRSVVAISGQIGGAGAIGCDIGAIEVTELVFLDTVSFSGANVGNI